MKTTLNIHDALLFEAKAFAVQQRTTLTRLIEEGLLMRLKPAPPKHKPVAFRLPTLPSNGGQGLMPGLNPLSNKSLYEAADGRAA